MSHFPQLDNHTFTTQAFKPYGLFNVKISIDWLYMGVSKYRGTPKSSHFDRVFHYKPSILGETPLFLETLNIDFAI